MDSNLHTLGPAESKVVLSFREQGRSVVHVSDVLAILGLEISALLSTTGLYTLRGAALESTDVVNVVSQKRRF